MSKYGRYQVAETPHSMKTLHLYKGTTLHTVDWEPPVGVLDQSDLTAQGIDTSVLVPGAQRVTALGSCTANATVAFLSWLLPAAKFALLVSIFGGVPELISYVDTVGAEKAAILFYHICSDQTGDPSQEWPPTDCGSSGPYMFSELQRLGIVKTEQIAHGADNIVSLLQSGPILVGQPFLQDWETPGPDAMIDGDGSVETVERQIRAGVAGGHETVLVAIEVLVLYESGVVNPWKTIVRFRNSWSKGWGDNGDYRAHLSTYSHILAPYCDFRQFAL